MKMHLCVLTFLLFVISSGVHAQSLGQAIVDSDAALEASRARLRDAIVQLKSVRMTSCKIGQSYDCDLATLSDIQLILLDVESKYHRASQRVASSATVDSFRKVMNAASSARSEVSDLADTLRDAHEKR